MSVKKDLATVEGHLEPINHEAAGISFDPTGTGSTADNVQDALVDALTGGSGSGDVTGIPPSDDKAITRYSGTTGKVIQNSPGTKVQDGGAVQAQAFLTNRLVDQLVTIPSNYSMLAADVDLEDGEIDIEEDGELVIL